MQVVNEHVDEFDLIYQKKFDDIGTPITCLVKNAVNTNLLCPTCELMFNDIKYYSNFTILSCQKKHLWSFSVKDNNSTKLNIVNVNHCPTCNLESSNQSTILNYHVHECNNNHLWLMNVNNQVFELKPEDSTAEKIDTKTDKKYGLLCCFTKYFS